MEIQIGKSIDITEIIDLFEAKEGDVEHIIGKTGQGKTYEASRRAIIYLEQGNVVYTTWRLNLPDVYDERENPARVLMSILFFKKRFYKFEYKKNWHFVNLDDYMDAEGVFDTEKFAKFLATRTDCIFMLDEGQDTFDSHQRAGKIARQSITRTRHMHKKLIIISQRAQAVDINARANVTIFYKCEVINFPFLPKFFRVRMTDEIDEVNNYPIWVRHDSQGRKTWEAPVYHSGFAKTKVYNAYDSWYMRKNMVRSQEVHLHGYELGFTDRLRQFYRLVKDRNDNKELSTELYTAKQLPLISQSTESVIALSHVNERNVSSLDERKDKKRPRVASGAPVKAHKISKQVFRRKEKQKNVSKLVPKP